MSDGMWRPLGVESEDEIAEYDALREGLPSGTKTQFWEWVRAGFTISRFSAYSRSNYSDVDTDLAQHAAQVLSVPMGSVQGSTPSANFNALEDAMKKVPNPLVVADFLLAQTERANAKGLDLMLQRSRSVWTVGERSGRRGLVRRVPEAVGEQVQLVARTAGTAGVKLVSAWEATYGLTPNPIHAYTMAIRAVEDAAIPVVVPRQKDATLGHVIGKMRADKDWRLPFVREPDDAPDGGVPVAMCRALWFGQHDRHGGVPTAPGEVSQEEAEAAVSLAVSLVHWFTTGMVARRVLQPF